MRGWRFSLYGLVLAWGCIQAALSGAAWAFGGWDDDSDEFVPVDRLVENLEQRLNEHPDSHDLLSQLARVHSYAFAKGAKIIGDEYGEREPREPDAVEKPEDFGGFSPEISFHPTVVPEVFFTDDLFAHLKTAIDYYTKAAAHKDADMLDWLGLGYTLRQAARYADRLATPEEAKDEAKVTARRRDYQDRALAAYEKALNAPNNSYQFNFNSVAYEACKGIVNIYARRDNLTKEEQRLYKVYRRKLPEIRMNETGHAVSPIIFSLDTSRSLSELLAPDTIVPFDLDATGLGKRWPWVQPVTAFLVWDANGDGIVPNGEALIGSVTWWIFWNNGYEVLQALDNDKDGWLQGAELAGFGVWQDGNANGVSDPGEVRPLSAVGVTGVAVSVTGYVDGMPANPQGLRLEDGRVLPTYDWFASPVAEDK